MRTTKLPPHVCPVCQHELDAASDYTKAGAQPTAGDLTVCAYCASVLEFDETLRPFKARPETLAGLDIPLRYEVERVRSAISAAWVIRKAKESR